MTSHSKEPLRVEVTPRISRRPNGVELHKKLSTYTSDLEAKFLVFEHDAEASALVLGKYLDRLRIQTEAANGILGQDEGMDWEHRPFWGAITNAVKLDQKRGK